MSDELTPDPLITHHSSLVTRRSPSSTTGSPACAAARRCSRRSSTRCRTRSSSRSFTSRARSRRRSRRGRSTRRRCSGSRARASDYRQLLPLFPRAVREWDFSAATTSIVSSSHCVAKGVDAKGKPHLCYCHTPMRYIWDRFDDYFPRSKPLRRAAMMSIAPWLRRWDVSDVGGRDAVRRQLDVRARPHPPLLRPRRGDHPSVRRRRVSRGAAAATSARTITSSSPRSCRTRRVDLADRARQWQRAAAGRHRRRSAARAAARAQPDPTSSCWAPYRGIESSSGWRGRGA